MSVKSVASIKSTEMEISYQALWQLARADKGRRGVLPT